MYATGYKTRNVFNSTGATQTHQGLKWNALYDGTKANVDIDLVNNNNTKHYSTTLNGREFATLYNDVLLHPVNKTPLEQRLLADFQQHPQAPLLLTAAVPAATRRRRKRNNNKHRHHTAKRHYSTTSTTSPPKAKSPAVWTPPSPF